MWRITLTVGFEHPVTGFVRQENMCTSLFCQSTSLFCGHSCCCSAESCLVTRGHLVCRPQMPSVFRSLVLAFALAALVTAGPYPARSSGNSGATITFADNRYNNRPGDVDSPPGGSSVQSGESPLPLIFSPRSRLQCYTEHCGKVIVLRFIFDI